MQHRPSRWYEPISSARCKPRTETPRLLLVMCQAAANQTVSGVLVRCKIVPAVTDTRRVQTPHDQRPASSRQPLTSSQ